MEYFGTGILYVASAGRSYQVEPDEKHLRSVLLLLFAGTQVAQYPVDAFAEICRWRNQAHDQISVGGKVVEGSGMHHDAGVLEQVGRKVFIQVCSRHAHHGVPTAFQLQKRTGSLSSQLAVEFLEVDSQAVQ